ncbi:MAG: hypothetical protein QXI58_06575 [Candidatus Micrarchaeia archaeon]
MNIKILTLIFLILGIVIIVICYWYFLVVPNNIRNRVINLLEEKLEFCKIVKEKINGFGDNGEFWLVCNGRPFYTEYKSGNISYKLNGWSFLWEEPEVWEELENCKFYDSKEYESEYQLSFYCVYENKLKTFIFDFQSNLLKKVSESNFLDYLFREIKEKYPSFSTCEIKNHSIDFSSYIKNFTTIFLVVKCADGNYKIWVDMGTYSLYPPILIDNLQEKDRAELSFRKVFNCPIDNLEFNKYVEVSSFCEGANLTLLYYFDKEFAGYKIDCQYEVCGNFLNKFVVIPVDKTKLTQTPCKKCENSVIARNGKNVVFYYSYDNRIILIGVKNEMV